MALKRISTELGARKLLQHLVASGRCQIEHFDYPPIGHVNPEAYRNLLRDPEPEEAVAISDPRDYIPATGATPAEEPELPLTLEQPYAEAPW
ncbi:MAG: hypothetical protein EBV32_05100 [Proteobacteria bacterium]|uniref:Uncharacterized protein n=1 Tax=Candidatus Fonsibacter lacus TaxID=2576439 RepID=A0A964UZ44_9PROT|nr:hypothetical protein [Candidatus Fonsibacter lacus]NCU72543.1 hypothetical protein [Candidatus Fonsibacter lacus]